jgi:hypothetical protein
MEFGVSSERHLDGALLTCRSQRGSWAPGWQIYPIYCISLSVQDWLSVHETIRTQETPYSINYLYTRLSIQYWLFVHETSVWHSIHYVCTSPASSAFATTLCVYVPRLVSIRYHTMCVRPPPRQHSLPPRCALRQPTCSRAQLHLLGLNLHLLTDYWPSLFLFLSLSLLNELPLLRLQPGEGRQRRVQKISLAKGWSNNNITKFN